MEEVQQQITNWDKFYMLMWKNSLLQWRHKVQTITEIIVPIMFCLSILVVRSFIVPPEVKNATYYKPIESEDTMDPQSLGEIVLGYTPYSEYFDDFTHGVVGLLWSNKYIQVENERQLNYLVENRSITAGIVYKNPANVTERPKNLKYSLIFPSEWGLSPEFFYNWQRNSLFSIHSNGGPGNNTINDTYPSHVQEALASIQYAMYYYFCNVHCHDIPTCSWSSTGFPLVTVKQFPVPPHTFGNFLELLQIFVSLSVILCLIYPTMNTVRFIVMEKERQLKHVMQMMGIPLWIQWTSWFFRTMILMMIIISFMVGLLKTSVFVHSDFTTIWVFLFMYSISMTTYCFMLSVFFSKANPAAAVSGLIWVMSYIPISLIYRKSSEEMFLSSKIIASLCSNTEMGYGVEIILRFEETGEGLQWSNFLKPVTNDDDISIGVTMAFMFMTSCVYLLVALFVEKIYHGSSGITGKLYFPFTKKCWCREKDNEKNEDNSDVRPVQFNANENDDNFEADSENRPATVRIENLRKIFGKAKGASRGLSLNLFEDKITVLLGSGKSTIISMLTGILPPTSGKVIINGNNIQKDQKSRGCIGFCLQQNILYDELTVREHIIFYCRLKGMSYEDGMEEVKKYVELLELEPQTNALPSNLSRGSQRKLSVGLALCAHSKVVFLDEPSSGMDPTDRRVLWDILQNEKKDRTILLTTNLMNEADMLGDRIAIMEDGKVKCCGTSLFLKRRLDVGYNLICVKEADCNQIWVTLTLRNFIPRIKLKSEIGSKLTYVLPKSQAYRFEKILKYLETDSKRLKLSSFGIWLSEDIDFSNICTDLRKPNETSRVQNYDTLKNFYEVSPMRGLCLELYQWHAMLRMKCIFWYRNWILLILQFLISVTFILLSVQIFRLVDTLLEPVDVSLNTYKNSVTMLQNDNLSVPHVYNYTRIAATYREIIQEHHPAHIVDEFHENIETRFLKLAKTVRLNLGLNSQYLVGMSPGESETVIAWFNNQPFNTVPLTINLIFNAIIRTNFGANFSVNLMQEPLPFTIKSKISNLLAGKNLGFQLAAYISFAMTFISAMYAIFHVKNRVSKMKQLQFIIGVRALTFWLASFLIDYMIYLSTVIVMISTIYVHQEEDWSTFDELLPAFVILVVFGFAILPITYVFSWFFSLVSSAIIGLTIIYLFTGAISFFVVAMLSLPFIVGTLGPFKDCLIIFPHYSLSKSLNNLNMKNMVKRLCQVKCGQLNVDGCDQEKLCSLDENCCERNDYALTEPGVGLNLICMFANGLIFFTVLLLVECISFKRFFQFAAYIQNIFRKESAAPQSQEDFESPDIEEEKRKVDAMSPIDLKVNNLVLKNVSKFYGKLLTVDQVSIGIQQSEYFGLFGVNGSGKTTIFEMVTGGTNISSGDAFVRGISLKTDLSNVRKMIGYCPQSNALCEELTGRETLEIFALLRGVRMKNIKDSINCLANDLNFMQQIDQKVSKYSAGNKRKLSAAVAFIGKPEVIYLDEPTEGMDPSSRQSLLNMVSGVRSGGTSIVHASNNVVDCEACSRIAIMVNGKLMCLGSAEDLRDRFSEGFFLTVKINSPVVKDDIESKFPTAELKKESENLLTYYIPPEREFKASKNFALMQSMKKNHAIEDYAIYRPSLDQIFSTQI